MRLASCRSLISPRLSRTIDRSTISPPHTHSNTQYHTTMAQGPASDELRQLLIVAPPNFTGNPKNPAAVAHAALEHIRNGGDDRFLFLRSILELQTAAPENEELLFHCITGCRQALLQKWTRSFRDLRNIVRDYLMELGIRGNQLPRSVRLACFIAAA